MRIFIILLAGIVAAVIGWVIAAAATISLGGYFGLTEFEGQRSMTAVFGIGPIGGLLGLISSCWVTARWTR